MIKAYATVGLTSLALVLGVPVVGAFMANWSGANLKAQDAPMAFKKDFINVSKGRFSGAVVVHGAGMKTIYVSGHTGRGEDLKTQAVAAYESLVKELAAAGAKPQDVVKLNTYIANFTPDDRAAYEEAKRKSFPQDDLPASTMVGVQALISPQNRIEVEAVAVVKE